MANVGVHSESYIRPVQLQTNFCILSLMERWHNRWVIPQATTFVFHGSFAFSSQRLREQWKRRSRTADSLSTLCLENRITQQKVEYEYISYLFVYKLNILLAHLRLDREFLYFK